MKNEFTPEHLAQEITVKMTLGNLFGLVQAAPQAPQFPARPELGRYALLEDMLPTIGEQWHSGEGMFAGITLDLNTPMALVLLPGDECMPWEKAGAWAKAQGGELPTRMDALVLWQNLPKEFREEWYWTSEQRAGYADFAWIQHFGDGDQSFSHKGGGARCRAVRRMAI